MLKFVFAIVFLVSAVPAATDLENTPVEVAFKQVYAKENITLHERPIVNKFGIDVREVKAVFTAKTSVSSVVDMLRNAENGLKWNLGAGAYDVMNSQNESWVTYIEYDLPWPLNDHDAVLRHTLIKNGNLVEVVLQSVDDVLPVKKGVDRMEQVDGKWSVKYIGFDTVEISYQVSTKPSPVPRLITDPIVHYQMVKSMSALRELLEQTAL